MSTGGIANPKYIMLGGFLGAGKTTAIARLANYLTERGSRVGIISNDQSRGLVDTAVLRGQGFAVEEITGGCFCCRFNSLLDAANKLTAESKPDVFLAEPVGSCTDLVATVSYPLRRLYGDRFTVAPLSVLVDPTRAARILGIEKGRSFSEKVVYVYRKQLEEADFIVVNKCDACSDSLRVKLALKLREAFPRAEVLCCSAREGTGLNEWFGRLMTAEYIPAATMELDYDRYAEGEAMLGWLNGQVHLTAEEPFDGDALLVDLANGIRKRLSAGACEIAHLKATLDADDRPGHLSVVSLVHGEASVDLCESLMDRLAGGSLIINLRAEANPDLLHLATKSALEECARALPGVTVKWQHVECFRPARPEPTHRMAVRI